MMWPGKDHTDLSDGVNLKESRRERLALSGNQTPACLGLFRTQSNVFVSYFAQKEFKFLTDILMPVVHVHIEIVLFHLNFASVRRNLRYKL